MLDDNYVQKRENLKWVICILICVCLGAIFVTYLPLLLAFFLIFILTLVFLWSFINYYSINNIFKRIINSFNEIKSKYVKMEENLKGCSEEDKKKYRIDLLHNAKYLEESIYYFNQGRYLTIEKQETINKISQKNGEIILYLESFGDKH